MSEKSGVKRKRVGEEPENDKKRCQTKLMLTKCLKQTQLTTGTLGLTKPMRPNDSVTTKLNPSLTRFTSPARRSASRPRTGRGSRADTDGRQSPPAPPPPSPRKLHPDQARQLRNWLLSGSRLTGGAGQSPGKEAAEQPLTPTSTRLARTSVRTSDPPPSPRTYTLEEDSTLDDKHIGAEN